MKIDSFVLWAPGVENHESWIEWRNGSKVIEDSSLSPKLSFASPIAIRRLSQLTRMTAYAVHELGPDAGCILLSSVYGEMNSQLKLNMMHIKEGEVKPAAFSLSVFNAPAAEATILEKSHTPYSVIFPGKDHVIDALFKAGSAPIASGRLSSSLLIYADERMPDEYRPYAGWIPEPMVIGIRISSGDGVFPSNTDIQPADLARYLIDSFPEAWI